jgi:hypothetical protein
MSPKQHKIPLIPDSWLKDPNPMGNRIGRRCRADDSSKYDMSRVSREMQIRPTRHTDWHRPSGAKRFCLGETPFAASQRGLSGIRNSRRKITMAGNADSASVYRHKSGPAMNHAT